MKNHLNSFTKTKILIKQLLVIYLSVVSNDVNKSRFPLLCSKKNRWKSKEISD